MWTESESHQNIQKKELNKHKDFVKETGRIQGRKEGRPPPIYTPAIMIAPQLPTPEQNAPTPATAPTLSGIQLPTVAL